MKDIAIKIGNFFFKYRNKVFPVIVASLFLATGTIHYSDPTAIAPLFSTKDIIALVIVLFGLAFRAIVIGFAYIKRGGLNKEVYAEKLVTEGIFNICRNPLYVGNMLICIGIFLLHKYMLVGLLGMALYFGIYQCIILAEEAYLSKKFGADYDNYCKTTPRWLPNFLKLPRAIKGMNFNIKRVIIKDYSTISVAICTFLILKTYQSWNVTTSSQTANYIFIMLLVGAAAGATRFFKKKGIIKE